MGEEVSIDEVELPGFAQLQENEKGRVQWSLVSCGDIPSFNRNHDKSKFPQNVLERYEYLNFKAITTILQDYNIIY